MAVILLALPLASYHSNVVMVVTSDSMLPVLKPYDIIVVEQTNIAQISNGDIIAFDSLIQGVGIVAHRAAEVMDDQGEIGVSTKSDNVDESGPSVVHDEDLSVRLHRWFHLWEFYLLTPSDIRY